MKRISFLLFPFFFIHAFVFAQKPWREGEMEVKVLFHAEGEAKQLAAMELSADIYSNYAWAYVTPPELQQIIGAGFDYTITKPDLNAWSAGFGDAMVPPGYYTFDQIKTIADSLATFFPSICNKIVYGYTSQNKELAALKISDNVNEDENEPEILFDGGIHGDEVGGSQNMIQFARDLCLAYGTDPYITGLINSREIWLYYCVNPFGRDYMTRYNGASVDLNRDFGFMWGGSGNSPGIFSQPESKALRNCQYENQFVSYTNYHSGAEIIAYPWSYRLSNPPDKPHIHAFAQLYSSSSGYSSLPYGQGSNVMYVIAGSTKDFNYACLGNIGWTIEISLDKQPVGNMIAYYYNVNKPAMLALIEHCGYGIQGTVTDAITHKPVEASIFIQNNYPAYSDPVVGDYHKYVIPGSYTLRVVANGYAVKTIPGVVVNALQATTVDIELEPLACQYVYRTISSYIPGFNPQDPGDETYTAACLGPPDNINYSIGKGGYLVFDMGAPVADLPGNDVIVYEGDLSPEGYSLYAGPTMDGPWEYLGFAMATSEFDLSFSGIAEARYFMIFDDNSGQSNVNDAGFDFDAMANIHPPVPDTLAHITGKVFDAVTGLPLAGATVASGDSIVFTDNDGSFQMNLLRGEKFLYASFPFYQPDQDTIQALAGYTTSHDFYLYSEEWLNVENKQHRFSLRIYPNPAKEHCWIQFENPSDGNVTISLVSPLGKCIQIFTDCFLSAGKHQIECQVNNYPVKGVYTLKVVTSTGVFTGKVVLL